MPNEGLAFFSIKKREEREQLVSGGEQKINVKIWVNSELSSRIEPGAKNENGSLFYRPSTSTTRGFFFVRRYTYSSVYK